MGQNLEDIRFDGELFLEDVLEKLHKKMDELKEELTAGEQESRPFLPCFRGKKWGTISLSLAYQNLSQPSSRRVHKIFRKFFSAVVNIVKLLTNCYFPRSMRYSAMLRAKRRPARAASSGELPAAPTSTSREPVVACWLYREFRSSRGRIRVG